MSRTGAPRDAQTDLTLDVQYLNICCALFGSLTCWAANHPRSPFMSGTPLRATWELRTTASVPETWALLSDTERFNRTVGFGFRFS